MRKSISNKSVCDRFLTMSMTLTGHLSFLRAAAARRETKDLSEGRSAGPAAARGGTGTGKAKRGNESYNENK